MMDSGGQDTDDLAGVVDTAQAQRAVFDAVCEVLDLDLDRLREIRFEAGSHPLHDG